MYELAERAVDAALAAGAGFADARVVVLREQALRARNGVLEELRQSESAGLGVRALVGSGWGHAATPSLVERDAAAAGARAAAVAAASARVSGEPARLAPQPPSDGEWENPVDEDPFEVGLSEKCDLLVGVTETMQRSGADLSAASLSAWEATTWLVSSEGTRLRQRLRKCGGGMNATALGDSETQRRSYPSFFGQYGTRGYELVRELDLPGHAERIANEARALLSAPPCPDTVTDLVLGSEQMALQIHESVGHAVELDRILGWEAAFAGTSWLDLRRLGSLRYGSDAMNIVADATISGGLGSFGYDDEGTPAHPVDIVRDGIWVGVLSGRDSAARAGLDGSGACVRADSWAHMPMVRMTNVGLRPGEASLDELVDGVEDGIFMENNRSWSIDDRRENFQFGCELAYEIRGGRLGRMLRNPSYTGIGKRFWRSLDGLAGPDELVVWGVPNCGKGQPMQLGHTGHPSVPGRFRGVRVGVRG